jgi:hypothetical protein
MPGAITQRNFLKDIMMKKDTLETLYQAGIGSRNLRNFEYGYFMPTPFSFESSFEEDPDLNDQNDDQENTEYEGEESETGSMEQTQQLPCFRQMVRAKKAELKAQFGKGHISIGECGVMPFRENPLKYNPIVFVGKVYSPFKDCGLRPDLRPDLWNVPCLWDCSKDKNKDKDCCVTNRNKENQRASAWSEWNSCRDNQGKLLNPGLENEEAYKAATARYNADKAAWDQCRAENKGIWVPGWRREWRKFKKAGGLNELKQQSTRCILGNPPTGTGTPPPPAPTYSGDPSELSCKDMATKFGIVPGKTFGTAPENIRNEWVSRKCTAQNVSTGIDPGDTDTTRAGRPGTAPAEEGGMDMKKMMIYGAIALVVIIAIILIVRMMRAKGN